MGTVIVLPAFNQDTNAWQQVKIGHRRMQIVNYQDLKLDRYTFDAVVQEVTKIAKTAEQPVILAGEDFGALVALRAAVDLLGRLDRLILVRPHLVGKNKLISTGLFSKGPLEASQQRELKQSLRDVDLTNQLMHVQGATFIFNGEQDKKNLKVAQDLQNRLIDGHLKVVPDMGKTLNSAGVHAVSENLR